MLDVHGVGYLVFVTPTTSASLRHGDTVRLAVSTIVREDAISLYGFLDDREQEIFDILIGVNGVGPKSALGVLGVMSPDDIADAVVAENDVAFKKVSGIGPKTAKLITLQLAGKIVRTSEATATAKPAFVAVDDQVVQALTGLGYQEKTAREVVEQISADADETVRGDQAAILRVALQRLGRGR